MQRKLRLRPLYWTSNKLNCTNHDPHKLTHTHHTIISHDYHPIHPDHVQSERINERRRHHRRRNQQAFSLANRTHTIHPSITFIIFTPPPQYNAVGVKKLERWLVGCGAYHSFHHFPFAPLFPFNFQFNSFWITLQLSFSSFFAKKKKKVEKTSRKRLSWLFRRVHHSWSFFLLFRFWSSKKKNQEKSDVIIVPRRPQTITTRSVSAFFSHLFLAGNVMMTEQKKCPSTENRRIRKTAAGVRTELVLDQRWIFILLFFSWRFRREIHREWGVSHWWWIKKKCINPLIDCTKSFYESEAFFSQKIITYVRGEEKVSDSNLF